MDSAPVAPPSRHGEVVIRACLFECDHGSRRLEKARFLANRDSATCFHPLCKKGAPTVVFQQLHEIQAMAAICCTRCGSHFYRARTCANDKVFHKTCGGRGKIVEVSANLDIRAWLNGDGPCVEDKKESFEHEKAMEQLRSWMENNWTVESFPTMCRAVKEFEAHGSCISITRKILERITQQNVSDNLVTEWASTFLNPPSDIPSVARCSFCARGVNPKRSTLAVCSCFHRHPDGKPVVRCGATHCLEQWGKCTSCRAAESK